MATDWSEGIAIAELADEPALSDELLGIIERVKNAPADGMPHIVLNFAGVSYVNSSNIAQLLRLRQAVEAARVAGNGAAQTIERAFGDGLFGLRTRERDTGR